MSDQAIWQKYTGKVAWPTIILFTSLFIGYILLWYAYQNGLKGIWTSLIGAVLAYGMFTISHEASHGNIAGGVKSYQKFELALGWLSSLFLLFPYSAFVVIHLRHHAHTNDPVKDPDNYVNGKNALSVLFRCITLIGHYFGLSFGKNSKKDPAMNVVRRHSLMFLIFLSAVLIALIVSGNGLGLFYVFILSALIAAPILAFSFDWIPHYPHHNLDKYHNTRVITIPGLEFVSLYQSYHLMHHLYPRVPFYKYKSCFQDYEEVLQKKRSPVEGFRAQDMSIMKKENTYSDIKAGETWNYILEVENIIQETHDTIRIVFKNLDITGFSYKSGQYIVISDYVGGKLVSRCYSICEDPLTGKLGVGVKRVPGGRLSNHLVNHTKKGSKLKISGVFGNFLLPDNLLAPLVLIAGGSGITPILSMLKTALRTSAQEVTLLYGCKSKDDIIFSDEIEELSKTYPDRLTYLLSHEILNTSIQHHYLSDIAKNSLCYICGPKPMMEASKVVLRNIGVIEENIKVEEFTYTTEKLSGEEYSVAVNVNKQMLSFPVDTSETILEASLRNKKELPYACNMGQCGTCKATLVEGEVIWSKTENIALLENELEQGFILPCVCKPKTNISLKI
ncbi:fatty acid desaturase [Aquimarina sp. MMG016]|uniref:fatty acid desaturase n=1 Tax=Aquimarina sp. MMG016 TaxID=2822690 RepID=UPI001B3A6A0D|nr:fatty acid desaturase [Aquimarina sp. MMG016]MBQ4821987.1 fatty acid desaturase [Aquimarina sp. MMG016]